MRLGRSLFLKVLVYPDLNSHFPVLASLVLSHRANRG